MFAIFKTYVGLADGAQIRLCDTIEHRGELGLVTAWIDNPSEGWSMPLRIIRLATLGYRPPSQAGQPYFAIRPVPTALLDGDVSPEIASEYGAIEHPDIRLPYQP